MNARQTKVIDALLSGRTVRQAADQVGVSERQIYRWLDQPAFRNALKEGQTSQLDAIGSRLVALSDPALDALENILDQPAQKGANVARLTAGTILDQTLRWRELVALEERVSQLEKMLRKDV